MNSNTSWIVGIIIVIIVLAGAWYIWGTGTAPAPANTQATGSSAPGPDTGTPADTSIVVRYTDSGFSPTTVTIAKGQTVTFTNNSSKAMWVASDSHPSHTGYDSTNRSAHCAAGYTGAAPFDECAAVQAGGSYTFTFEKAGTWNYHNHSSASDVGTVIVQ